MAHKLAGKCTLRNVHATFELISRKSESPATSSEKNDSLIEVCFNLASVHNVLYTMGHRRWPGINLLVCAVLSSPTLITVTARYCSAKYAFLALVC